MEELRDKTGRVIKVGDIVTFNFCADHIPHHNCNCPKEQTTMIDFVDEGDGNLYFVNDLGFVSDLGGAAYAWRYNEYSRIVGTMKDNPEIFHQQKLPQETVVEVEFLPN